MEGFPCKGPTEASAGSVLWVTGLASRGEPTSGFVEIESLEAKRMT